MIMAIHAALKRTFPDLTLEQRGVSGGSPPSNSLAPESLALVRKKWLL